MSPEVLNIITRAIYEVNRKSLGETKQTALEGYKEEYEKEYKEGYEEGYEEGKKEMIKKFKNIIDIEKLSRETELSIEEIQKL